MNPTATLSKIRTLARLALIPLFCGAPMPVPAVEGDQTQEPPIYLEADGAELDDLKATSIYTGNVYVQQGDMELWADEVTVHHYPDRQPERVIALGAPAKFRQQVEGDSEDQIVKGESLRMEYEAKKNEITLIDQALVYQGDDTFRSDRIVYDRAKATVKAGARVQGKERVKITINPSKQ